MTDYTKSTNFATKDSLPPGSALKIVRGTEIDTEFNNIVTAVATKANSSDVTTSLAAKADLASPALTGTPTAPTPTAGDNDTSIATTAFVSTAVSTAVATAVNNVGYPAFKNRIINGAMMIDQRNAGASVTASTTSANVYLVDRWCYNVSAASKFTVQQNAGSVTPPAGFINYLGITSSSAYSVGASDTLQIRQGIEGLSVADLGWGAAGASTVTLSFWVRSSLTGTFGAALCNNAGSRSYPFSYTINAANTWEQKSVTIAGDTTGTWLTTNGVGIYLLLSMGTGSSLSGTAGAWVGSYTPSVTGATSVVGTSGATFYITGVQLEKGSTATSFDYRPYGTELALCQRYYWQTSGNFAPLGAGFARTTTVFLTGGLSFPVQMRAAPSLSATNSASAFGVSIGGTDLVGPTVSLQSQISTTCAGLSLTIASGSMTVGQSGQLYTQGTSTFVGFSSEL